MTTKQEALAKLDKIDAFYSPKDKGARDQILSLEKATEELLAALVDITAVPGERLTLSVPSGSYLKLLKCVDDASSPFSLSRKPMGDTCLVFQGCFGSVLIEEKE